VAGFVIRELSPVVSNWRADSSLAEYLEKNGIPGIQGIDTRALTKKLRVRGAMNGFISTEEIPDAEAIKRSKEICLCGRGLRQGSDAQAGVSLGRKDEQSASFKLAIRQRTGERAPVARAAAAGGHSHRRLRLRDEYNILRRLRQHGFGVQVLPATATPPRRSSTNRRAFFYPTARRPSALNYIVRG